jgi:hypothetical protein
MGMMYKVKISVYFNYGGITLGFKKNMELPFVPYLGLSIIFDDEKEYELKLDSDNNYKTDIGYNIKKNQFEIIIHEYCRYQISDEKLNYIFDKFSDWEKLHDLEDEKKLMNSL